MLVRRATAADIPLLQALERQAESAAHWSEGEYSALFSSETPRRLVLVAQDDNEQVCAFIIAHCGIDDWEIENIVVAPQHRYRGIGSSLVREIVNEARLADAISVLLEVRESNLAARQLYEMLGFVETGRRPAYYRKPDEDALLLKFSTRDL